MIVSIRPSPVIRGGARDAARNLARLASCLLACAWLLRAPCHAQPVMFEFRVTTASGVENPHARAIFADVCIPSGDLLRLPAYHVGQDRWAIRARADQPGEYTLARVVEQLETGDRLVDAAPADSGTHTVSEPARLLPITRDPADHTRLVRSDRSTYVPIGANLAWADGPRVAWHEDALRQFGNLSLNWTRIWMCHWGATNLDWLPEDMGPSPAPGTLDPRIATHWDAILRAAEANGVYVQLVLQHHGQYTTGANANWAINPWSVANGGFLAAPAEFFTSRRAIALTKQKYRYIVARWAYSPAILAWELFNEVHWTNGYKENEAGVAAWHSEMAAYLRSIDPYHHLVTTSLEDLHSPIYAAMDYFQPHRYAINMLTGVRTFETPFASLDRPVFFGEIGDDKMPVTDAEKRGGSQLTPQVWASLMGPGPMPGQSWHGEVYLRTGRLGELGAVARFLRATRLGERRGLEPFSPATDGGATMPLRFIPGYDWARHRTTTLALPLDGSAPLAANDLPGILVGSPSSITEGYPGQVELDLEVPRDTMVHVRFADAGVRGAAAELRVDTVVQASHSWPDLPGAPSSGPQPADAPKRPASVSTALTRGKHRLTIRNTGATDWVAIAAIEFDLPKPLIAAAGKRSPDFIALWAWNEHGVHALQPTEPASTTILIPEVDAGRWTVTWWESEHGVPGTPTMLEHPGGLLRLTTPPITRHVAAELIRGE